VAVQGKSLAPFFMNFVQIFMLPEPPDIGGPLWVTHLCWIVGTVVLYFPCRWFARVAMEVHPPPVRRMLFERVLPTGALAEEAMA